MRLVGASVARLGSGRALSRAGGGVIGRGGRRARGLAVLAQQQQQQQQQQQETIVEEATGPTEASPEGEVAEAPRPPVPEAAFGLREPAYVCARGNVSQSLEEMCAEGVCLEDYMTLPVEQYVLLPGLEAERLADGQFLFTGPRLRLFSVWIQPLVTMQVASNKAERTVRLSATSCEIRGSELIEKTRLNERFHMQMESEITWAVGDGAAAAATEAEAEEAEEGLCAPENIAAIYNKVSLNVWAEVVPPFSWMPRRPLEASTSSILQGVIPTLQKLFLKQLSEDYLKWSTDADYRLERSKLSSAPHQ